MCTDPGASTPIGAIRNYLLFLTLSARMNVSPRRFPWVFANDLEEFKPLNILSSTIDKQSIPFLGCFRGLKQSLFGVFRFVKK